MKEPPVLVACLNLDGARLVVYEGGGEGRLLAIGQWLAAFGQSPRQS